MLLTKIEPGGLALEPGIQDVLDENQRFLPHLNLLLKWFDEGGAPHRLGLNNVVIKQYLDLIHCREDRHSLKCEHKERIVSMPGTHEGGQWLPVAATRAVTHSIPVLNKSKLHLFPLCLHLLQGLLQRVLLAGSCSNLLQPARTQRSSEAGKTHQCYREYPLL